MVTVVCITYGQEDYIAQTLDSFLAQQTTFKFKILVGEDAGPDGTADIVRDYATRYPDLIVPFIRAENLGPKRNLVDLCQRATSPYIAFCEGDDYWTDPLKLQKQFEYMEAHPKIKVCGTRTEVISDGRSHVEDWFERQSDGRIYYPDSQPNYHGQKLFKPTDILRHMLVQTSSLFYRWNYDLPIPDWYYDGVMGDWSMLLMQTGTTRIGFLPDVTSVYRINSSSTFYGDDRTVYFLNTRLEWLHGLTGFLDYAQKHYRKYPLAAIRNKIQLEAANYLSAAIKVGDMGRVARLFDEYPVAGKVALSAYLGAWRDRRLLVGELTWDGYRRVVRDAGNRKLLGRLMRPVVAFQGWREQNLGRLRRVGRIISYWSLGAVPKDRALWVFTSFRARGYQDNSRHLYEWVSRHAPEISPVWVSLDETVVEHLRERGFVAHLATSIQGRRALRHASLAITDHYRQSDFAALPGFNHGTKTVQLWHGVGLKYMGDLRNTAVPGVKRSQRILPQSGDSIARRFLKRLLYFRYAPFRELMEEYYGFVCPGPKTARTAEAWGVPMDARVIAGYPRNAALVESSVPPASPRVLYAPTYRWDPESELDLVRRLCEAIPDIERAFAARNGTFVIRLHPHTWRDYRAVLAPALHGCRHVELDESSDIADTLADYSVLVTDYSSIMSDFLLLDRPCVFFCYDLDEYERRETNLAFPYREYSPGVQTQTWAATLDALEDYLSDPSRDGEWRRRVLGSFWDPEARGSDSSERIVRFLKNRLGI